MTICVATSNAGKLRDFRAAAAAYPHMTIEPLPGLADIAAPPENEPSFEGNARTKAIYYSRLAPGTWVIADDSGLEVDALEGRPGVRSARFSEDVGIPASEGGLDEANNTALTLAMLEQTNRAARYRCALALASDGTVELVTFGKLEGEILQEAECAGGFGYDPLFYVPELGCTMAQAGLEDRMRVSHRGRALAALLRQWRKC